MALEKSHLALVANGGSFRIWNYRTSDSSFTNGYFNGVAQDLFVGDMIIINEVDDLKSDSPSTYKIHIVFVKSRSANTVTLTSTNLTTIQ